VQSDPPQPASPPAAPRLSRAAVVSFFLGLLSPLLLLLTGVPAIVIGLSALRGVNVADGRLRGRRLAAAGIALGGLGCVLTVIGLAVLVYVTVHTRGQRLECENNLRRIGAAVNNYQTNNNAFPPAALPNAALPPDKRLSWLAALPPYLESTTRDAQRMKSLYDQLDVNAAWDAGPNATVAHTAAPLCICPAHAAGAPNPAPGHTDYVGMAGVGPNAAALPLTDPNAGIFGYNRTVRHTLQLDDVTAGVSEVLMATETERDNGPWTAGGPPTVRGLDRADAPYTGPGRPFGGMHPGGQNGLFADGSARFLNDDISPAVFETMTRLAQPPPTGPAQPAP